MDPTVTLTLIRSMIAEIDGAHSDEKLAPLACDLAELVTDLDEWLTRGGFLPAQWRPQK
jgi:hypothetical protein